MKINKNFRNILKALSKEDYKVLTFIYREFNNKQLIIPMNRYRLKNYQRLDELSLITLIPSDQTLDQYYIVQLTVKSINLLSSISLDL